MADPDRKFHRGRDGQAFLRELGRQAGRSPLRQTEPLLVRDCNSERVFIYAHILVFADTILSAGSAPRNVNVEEHYVFRWQNNSISGLDITIIRAEISARQRGNAGEGFRMLAV